MSATRTGCHLDFQREQHEMEFVEQNEDILYELSRRMGELAGKGDRLGLTLMATALNNLCRLALSEYEARHGSTSEA